MARFFIILPLLSTITSVSSTVTTSFSGTWFSGTFLANSDGEEWLTSLETARSQFSPNPFLQDISMLYNPLWNGFVEGPTWADWWTQNSYGTTLADLPWLEEPLRTWTLNANWMWFNWIGNGTRVGLDDPHPAPDGCLCDAANPQGAYYKQGDGNVPIHDWALEETLSAVIMQSEQLLIDRDSDMIALYLPLFNRTLTLIESRRDITSNLFWCGVSSNLLAPSYGAYLLPNGTRSPAFLTGMSVSYIAALDRVIELAALTTTDTIQVWQNAAIQWNTQRRNALQGLTQMLAPPSYTYFVKWQDPDGTLHGVLNNTKHKYIEAVVNHDAIALGIAERVREGLNENIMTSLLATPGLRPNSFIITNSPGLDDMEESDASWLWSFGTWVNGGAWQTCEARMMLAYWRTGRSSFALESMRAQLAFSYAFRQDSPLVNFGASVYQPDEPINTVFDCWAVPAALIRGLWDPTYTSQTLTITPHVPGNVSQISQTFPIRWGPHRFYFSANGSGNVTNVTGVTVNNVPFLNYSSQNITFEWASLPIVATNFTIQIQLGLGFIKVTEKDIITTATATAAVRSLETLRTLIPEGAVLWLAADNVGGIPDGASLAYWPDARNDVSFQGASQHAVQSQPILSKTGMNHLPTINFNGQTQWMTGNASLPAGATTIIAVMYDRGESSDCCSGIFWSSPGCAGLSTKRESDTSSGVNTTVLVIDWVGSGDTGLDDISNRQIIASVVYNTSGSYSFADGCVESSSSNALAGDTFMIGSRGADPTLPDRYFNGSLSEIIVFPFALNDTIRETVEEYFAMKWPRSGSPLRCNAPGPPPNCTLPSVLNISTTRLDTFISQMRTTGGFSDALYELAHALAARASVTAWGVRCAGLGNGTILPLPSKVSEVAADALYVNTAINIFNGLSIVLNGYADSTDERKLQIYNIWMASA